ncbi:MAG TPA: efflux RND transporter periplasmic adaptor subunit [Woeseiaceae bacterium]|nr:efflux RND transporter periplasmic adaptor subunit [Woeseiaceae bacterium]
MLVFANSHARAAAELPFETATAEVARAPLERVYDGTVEAVHKATVSAQTAGRIAELFYDVDDYVESGEPIVRFTDVEQRAALRQAQANLEAALAHQQQAVAEFRRAEGLFQSGSSSKREYDQALAARDAAVARVAAARSSVETAEQQLEYTLVRAPYAGIVTERHVEVGEAVAIGQPLMSGLSLESLRVVVELPQQVAARVRDHKAAWILTDDGRVEAESVTIFPFADSASNTFTVRVELPDGQFALYPGMFVKVAFVVGDAEHLLVPTRALLRRSEVTGVYVVSADGDVRLRQVRAGNTFGDRTEILAGLSAGERVALDPVRAGIHVKSRAVANDEE